jgi:DNA-binding NtrC family response regulator
MGNKTMSPRPSILVVAVDSEDCNSILRTLDPEPYRVLVSNTPEDAEQQLSLGVDVAVLDLQSKSFDALDLLRRWQSWQSRTAFVLITDDRDVALVVEAMKLGTADCLVKPVDPEELRMLIAKLLDSRDGAEHANRDDPRQRGGRPPIDIPPGTSLEDLQRAAVEQALEQHHGNRTHAAKTLGISVRTLQRKLKAWGIPLASMPQQPSRSAPHHFLLAPHESHSSFSAHAH